MKPVSEPCQEFGLRMWSADDDVQERKQKETHACTHDLGMWLSCARQIERTMMTKTIGVTT